MKDQNKFRINELRMPEFSYKILLCTLLLNLTACGGSSNNSKDNGDTHFEMSGQVDGIEININTDAITAEFGFDEFALDHNGGMFEFQTEELVRAENGTYVIGEDFEAVDMENEFTNTNLHAYTGTLIISSTESHYQGSFELTEFADDHLSAVTRIGLLTGSFSIPFDKILDRSAGAMASDTQ